MSANDPKQTSRATFLQSDGHVGVCFSAGERRQQQCVLVMDRPETRSAPTILTGLGDRRGRFRNGKRGPRAQPWGYIYSQTPLSQVALTQCQSKLMISLKTGDATGSLLELPRSLSPALARARIETNQIQSIEEPDISLIHAIARAHLWLKALCDGSYLSIEELARAAKWNPKVIRKALRLAFLAPDITEAIILGSHPISLSMSELQAVSALSWDVQRRFLRIPTAA